MDDDDDMEIQSQSQTSPSPSNGRITVTVAAAAVAEPQQQQQQKNNLAVIPFQIQQQPPKSNGGGREDCWSEGATGVLIDAWGERYLELSRGNLKQKHWKEVADIVSSREDYTKSAKTDIQCKNRIDTVKKKYKLEKAKIAAGAGPSKWPFFQRLDQLIGPVAKSTNASNIPVGIPVNSNVYRKVQLKSNNVKGGQFRKRGHQVETEEEEDSEEEEFEDSDDSLPPPEKKAKRVVVVKEKKGWGNSIRMLTQAMLKFGEVYEQAESAKLQQVVEMEKARMKFAKDLELQRMQFFIKTQMEISQLKPCTRGANGSNQHHHSGVANSLLNPLTLLSDSLTFGNALKFEDLFNSGLLQLSPLVLP
ncbi:trihelix transcription factor ASIL2 isoform X1 [Ricinus communis]|uniref:trihelix transcription factor ASIL2 isoform X1 n=1 Tax=Ricinus communis TaxID=3988 RepID=UPI0007724884|nr:trihelix transcription factor ASIL2 isoform X1 [Ricinus communis]|eukprot:XP_015580869.1 trihelix transcription factor ASIL2 isoform X1 [Ricinus communis]